MGHGPWSQDLDPGHPSSMDNGHGIYLAHKIWVPRLAAGARRPGKKKDPFPFFSRFWVDQDSPSWTAGATVRLLETATLFKRSTQAHQERVNLKRWVGNVNVATITKVEIHVVDVVHLNERPMQEILPLPMLSDRPSG